MKKEIKPEDINIKKLIKDYSELYSLFEILQEGKSSIFPTGDQKTGVIAEYYAKCYIEKYLAKPETVFYAKTNKPYDIEYQTKSGDTIKVQVKAVSAHSKSRRIAPINVNKVDGKPFDYLYLIDLNVNFIPIGFYINTYDSIEKVLLNKKDDRTKLSGTEMKGQSLGVKSKSGSVLLNFRENQIKELLQAIK